MECSERGGVPCKCGVYNGYYLQLFACVSRVLLTSGTIFFGPAFFVTRAVTLPHVRILIGFSAMQKDCIKVQKCFLKGFKLKRYKTYKNGVIYFANIKVECGLHHTLQFVLREFEKMLCYFARILQQRNCLFGNNCLLT